MTDGHVSLDSDLTDNDVIIHVLSLSFLLFPFVCVFVCVHAGDG